MNGKLNSLEAPNESPPSNTLYTIKGFCELYEIYKRGGNIPSTGENLASNLRQGLILLYLHAPQVVQAGDIEIFAFLSKIASVMNSLLILFQAISKLQTQVSQSEN